MKRSPRAASSLLHLFCPVYLPRSVAPKKHGDVNDPSTRIKPNKKRVSWLGRVDVYRGTTAIKTFNGIKCTDAGRSRKRSALLNNTQKLQVSVKRFDKPRPNLAGNETVFTRATGDGTKRTPESRTISKSGGVPFWTMAFWKADTVSVFSHCSPPFAHFILLVPVHIIPNAFVTRQWN